MVIIRQATVVQTPDPGFPSDNNNAVNPTVTGHDATTITDTGLATPPQQMSCRWSGFVDLPWKTKITLKITSNLGGVGGASTDVSGGGSANATAVYGLRYSTDGGSTFANVIDGDTESCSGNCSNTLVGGGSFSIDISPTIALDQIQIRERNTATATASGGAPPASAAASVRTTISGIQLEVTVVDFGVITIM